MTTINPYLSAPTADTGAQVIILGHSHSSKIGLNISCLPRTATVLDCANASATGAMGVSYGCIRGKSGMTGKTMVHRGMVYVIEGDIFLLAQTALKDLGVIPAMFPRIGEFGGIEKQGDGLGRFEVDEKFNVRYIAAETHPRISTADDGFAGDSAANEDDEEIGQTEAPASINSSHTAAPKQLSWRSGDRDPHCNLLNTVHYPSATRGM